MALTTGPRSEIISHVRNHRTPQMETVMLAIEWEFLEDLPGPAAWIGGAGRAKEGWMTDQTQIRRDPLVEHAVPLVAKAMYLADDANDLWEYFRDRVDAERHRIVEDAIREAIEPLEERFAIDDIARVASAMATEHRPHND
jgi:hypothetical protein